MVLNALGVLLVVAGVIWFLQGIGLVGGSFMTGQTLWLVIGIVVALAGLALLGRRFVVRDRSP